MPEIDHIEIIGPAGAGKSTILTTLSKSTDIFTDRDAIKHILREEVPTLRWFDRFPTVFYNSVVTIYWKVYAKDIYTEGPKVKFSEISRILDKGRKQGDRRKYMRICRNKVSEANIIYDKFSSPVIFDEGLTQFAATVFRTAGEKPGQLYLSLIPEPDLVISIDCPSEVCLERQKRRKKSLASSVSNVSHSEAIDRIEKSRMYFKAVGRYMQRQGSEIITINTYKNSTEECVNLIKENKYWALLNH